MLWYENSKSHLCEKMDMCIECEVRIEVQIVCEKGTREPAACMHVHNYGWKGPCWCEMPWLDIISAIILLAIYIYRVTTSGPIGLSPGVSRNCMACEQMLTYLHKQTAWERSANVMFSGEYHIVQCLVVSSITASNVLWWVSQRVMFCGGNHSERCFVVSITWSNVRWWVLLGDV